MYLKKEPRVSYGWQTKIFSGRESFTISQIITCVDLLSCSKAFGNDIFIVTVLLYMKANIRRFSKQYLYFQFNCSLIESLNFDKGFHCHNHWNPWVLPASANVSILSSTVCLKLFQNFERWKRVKCRAVSSHDQFIQGAKTFWMM